MIVTTTTTKPFKDGKIDSEFYAIGEKEII